MSDVPQVFQCESTNEVEKSSFKIEWKIHRSVIEELTQEKHGKRQSPCFNSVFYNSTWFVLLNSLGSKEAGLNVTLRLTNATIDPEKILTRYRLIVKNNVQTRNIVQTSPDNMWLSRGILRKHSESICDGLIHESYFINDYMIITYEVSVKVVGRESVLTSLPVNPPKPKCQDSLAEKYLKVLHTGAHSDVILSVGDVAFKAHKIILATNCEYFEAMFGDGFKESADKVVEIKDVDPKIFKVILEFIYTNQLPEDLGPIVKDLLAAADRFCLKPVVKKCQEKLSESISLDNCVELLILTDTFNQTELKQELIAFIRFNIKKIVDTVQWKELKSAYPLLAFEAIEKSVKF